MSERYLSKDEKPEQDTTTAEKILAIALAVFLLIGGLRIAESINNFFVQPDYNLIRQQFFPAGFENEYFQLQTRSNELLMEIQRLKNIEENKRLDYEKAREEYRTILDKGIDDPIKKAFWEKSRDDYELSQKNRDTAETTLKTFQTEILNFKETTYRDYEKRFQEEYNRQTRSRNFKAGVSLLIYALVGFALSFLVYNFFRTRTGLSRYSVIGMSFLGFGALQALIVSFRIAYPYLRYIIPVEGIVSVGGTVISITGIVYLKNKFFSSKAVRNRRLWRRVCTVCGFPDPGNYCSWCGSEQLKECPKCKKLTNKFLPSCRECGEKL